MPRPPQGDHDPFDGSWAQTAAHETEEDLFTSRIREAQQQAKLLAAFLQTLVDAGLDRQEALTLACAVWRA